MVLARVIFGRCGKHEPEDLKDLAEGYLASFHHSGQICGQFMGCVWTKGELNAHVWLSAPSAYARRYHSKWGIADLKKVREAFGQEPRWVIISDDSAGKRAATWRKAPFLYLVTNSLDWEPPVYRGDNGQRVPSPVLPLSDEDRAALYFWQGSYRDYDNIWLGSGTLEIPAYRELAEPDSELTKLGRELCRKIEKATHVPTYYYLDRYWGRTKGEEKRVCPSCGRKWRTKQPTETRDRFWQFEFQCGKCRLVSHLAVCSDDARHASIGEYRPSGKARGQRKTHQG